MAPPAPMIAVVSAAPPAPLPPPAPAAPPVPPPVVARPAVSVEPAPAAPRFTDDGRCHIAIKGDSPVAHACADGGIKRAKATMKSMQKLGKERGLKFECDDCHKDEAAANWTLSKGAEDKFKKLLAAQSAR